MFLVHKLVCLLTVHGTCSQEAIKNSEGEWSQHKKLIDTSKRGFRRSMVKNLPYFHVWFSPNEGYGHVIEEEKDFPAWFGKVNPTLLDHIHHHVLFLY